MTTERATEAKTTTHIIAWEIRRARTIVINFCNTIGWLRREIDVGSFRHVHGRYMAGGTRRTQTFTTNMDQHSVFPFRFGEAFSVRVGLQSASSASARACDADRGFVYKVKNKRCATYSTMQPRSSRCSGTKPSHDVDMPKPPGRMIYFDHGAW